MFVLPYFLPLFLLSAVTHFILSKYDIWAKQLYLFDHRQSYSNDTCRLHHVIGDGNSTVVPVSARKA